tara:strand:+ start:423 stop:815 length:393 start_codon:yes stop_codon:yes gene_type:complete
MKEFLEALTMKKFLEGSIAFSIGLSCLGLMKLFQLFPHEVSFQNIALSLSPIAITSCLYLIYLKGSKDGETNREFIQELYRSWEAENEAEYYSVSGTVRKRTIYEDVEVFNKREWIQFSTLIDVINCFKK